MDEERSVAIDDSPLTLIKEGIDQIVLPKFSINTIKLNSLNYVDASQVPSNNFSIQTLSETCIDKNNRKIIIKELQSRRYNANINGVDYNFSKDLIVEKLSPETYDLCITIEDEDFEQCHEITINAEEPLAGKISLVKNKVAVDIEQGSAPFRVVKNGEVVMITDQKHFKVDVVHGDQIDVNSKVDCQGLLSKKIDLFENVNAYPNPSKGVFDIYISTDVENVDLRIYNMYSQLISTNTYPVNGGKVHVDISKKPRGVYFVQVGSTKPVTVKVVKY